MSMFQIDFVVLLEKQEQNKEIIVLLDLIDRFRDHIVINVYM